MKRVELGKTGIMVSRLGIGTGTGLPSGHCAQALMDEQELARLLLYALDRGINFWDTAFQYNTYPHIKEALKQVSRKDVVLTTKFSAANEKETIRDFNITLKDLNIDYVDVCLLHGVRTDTELQMRSGAFNAMVKLKKEREGSCCRIIFTWFRRTEIRHGNAGDGPGLGKGKLCRSQYGYRMPRDV